MKLQNQFQFLKSKLVIYNQNENIPAIDIIDGKCVRLSKGITTKIIYNENPLEVAKEFEHTESNICI
jgi:hypothetical protein